MSTSDGGFFEKKNGQYEFITPDKAAELWQTSIVDMDAFDKSMGASAEIQSTIDKIRQNQDTRPGDQLSGGRGEGVESTQKNNKQQTKCKTIRQST